MNKYLFPLISNLLITPLLVHAASLDDFNTTKNGTTGVVTYTPNSSGLGSAVLAKDDAATLVIDATSTTPTVDVNILNNDVNAGTVSLTGSTIGQYGYIVGGLGQDGKLTYRVDLNNNAVKSLPSGATLTDTFGYVAIGKSPNQNLTSQGKINIYIVAGTSSAFKAFDLVESINAISSAAPITDDLLAYNNNLLGSKDTDTRVQILGNLYGKYGFLQFSSATNKFTYTLNNNVPEIQALQNTDNTLQETFDYSLTNRNGNTVTAKIIINIVSQHDQVSTNNVELENNNNSDLATPLNSGLFMNGNLMNASDRDWYFITTSGNEKIHIDLCPQGFACNNEGAWVLYVFDGDNLTQEMQNKTIPLVLRRDDTGQTLASANYDHMYLLYNFSVFDNALLGVIDPCYPGPSTTTSTTQTTVQTSRTSLDIGVKSLAPGATKNIFFAISSPLQRSGGTTSTGSTQAATCSSGDIVLTKAGPTFKEAGVDVKTTQEFIAIFPNSDDQYTFKVTRTGISPLSTQTSPDSVVLDSKTGKVKVPVVRVMDNVYSAELLPGINAKSTTSTPYFNVGTVTPLPQAVTPNPYMATYNPVNNMVKLPKVTIDNSNQAYSVDLHYLPGNKLEFISASPLQ